MEKISLLYKLKSYNEKILKFIILKDWLTILF